MPLSKFPAQLENLKVGRGIAYNSRTLKKDKRTDGFTRSTNDITDDLARSSNKNKGTDDLANSSKKNKKTCDGGEKITSDDLARSSNKNKGTDDLSNSCKKNKTTCNGGGKTADPFVSDVLNEDPFCNLDSMGYPKLVRDVPERLVLVNTFEDTFGDIYGGGVWSELSETASSNMSQNVVSLASFYGEKRIFACTGSFIEWNGCVTILTSASLVSQFVGDQKIAENLRIEVLLPNEDYIGGALQHYNLHYNVALVNVKDFTAHNPVNIEPQRSKYSSELVAVGRCFKSGVLMAARGKHTSMLHKLDCKLVKYSTCKITKAGIGGPLVDSDGKFIGMNFCGIDLYAMNLHDVKRTWTPFLSSDVILNVLAYFKTKRYASVCHVTVAMDISNTNIFRFPTFGRKASLSS
ncbi:unnamed protein product [Urochloa decumbens]|uniref:Uncharacterized protein n=1 Tax=Urochloa decumbens TaxID=240449 RepID=A0ABC9H1B9_9POAL